MRLNRLVLSALVMAGMSGPTLAAETAAPDEKKICKTFQDIQWRTVKHRVCLTQAHWEHIARLHQEGKEEFRNAGRHHAGQ